MLSLKLIIQNFDLGQVNLMIVVGGLYDTVSRTGATPVLPLVLLLVQGHARAVHDLHVGDKALGGLWPCGLGIRCRW